MKNTQSQMKKMSRLSCHNHHEVVNQSAADKRKHRIIRFVPDRTHNPIFWPEIRRNLIFSLF